MSAPIYTPQEMVRLELLHYDNPEGIHPIEAAWRDLARKLMEQVIDCQHDVIKLLDKTTSYNIPPELKDYKPYKFPQPFHPDNKI